MPDFYFNGIFRGICLGGNDCQLRSGPDYCILLLPMFLKMNLFYSSLTLKGFKSQLKGRTYIHSTINFNGATQTLYLRFNQV